VSIDIPLDPRRVAVVLGFAIGGLLLANVAGHAYWLARGAEERPAIVRFVDVRKEGNLPSIYSALSLLGAAALAGVIAAGHPRPARREALGWTAMAGLLAFMAVDEAFEIHEHLRVPGVRFSLTDPWVPAGIVLATAAAAVGLPFIRRLPRRTAALLAAAGATVVAGALGVEVLDDVLHHSGLYERRSVPRIVTGTLEEGLEMAGVALCIHALLSHIERHAGSRVVSLLGGRVQVAVHAGRGAAPALRSAPRLTR
jgi:hypothetical protein